MPQDLLPFWYRALAAEFGLELTVSDPNIVSDLYQARKAAADPRLDGIMITKMKDGTLWLIKKEVNMEDGDAPTLT